MRNRNSSLKKAHSVKSISDPRDIERLRTLLNPRPRDLLFFDLALETGMPAKQLLRLNFRFGLRDRHASKTTAKA